MPKLSFSQRLHDQEDFAAALKIKGLSLDKLATLHICPNNAGFERLGIVVSKRVINKASSRNKIKRIIREAFRKNAAKQMAPLDFVVKLRRSVNQQQEQSFAQMLSKSFADVLNL